MLEKFSRYYHTIKNLKPIQIRYQLWYKMRDRFFSVKVPLHLKASSIQKIKMQQFPAQYRHYLEANTFRFLNIDHSFDEKIDWDFKDHGKLWAYHLNYFDFLHQSKMDYQIGKELIYDFLEDLLNRKEGLEPYPISLRTINWIKFLSIHQDFNQEIIDSLYVQYQVLIRKLEYHLLGNHLLENGFSLLFAAVLFRENRFEKLATKILMNELDEQILNDGSHFELSTMYHLIILQRALDCFNLLQNNDHMLDEVQFRLRQKIQQMINWLYTIRFSNGDVPMFSDSTEGQALKPGVILNYARELGFKPEKVELKESGYRKIESGFFELVADVGEVGPFYQPGHAHADCLNFVLQYNGQPVIVDRKISTYEKNEQREEERGTSSHNTVSIKNMNQSDMWGGFRVGKRAKPILIKDNESALKASHNGYDQLGARHEREWFTSADRIVIEDVIQGYDETAVAFLHFHPVIKLEKVDEQTFRTENLIFKFLNSTKVLLDQYEYCEGFNKRRYAISLKITFSKKLATIISNV